MSTTLWAEQEMTQRETIDRWFFATMAGVLLLIAIVGFTPNSVAILSGSKENPSLVVHFHAFAMFSWLLLFLVQASLIGLGKSSVHGQLGRLLFALGPIIVLLMIYLAITRFPGWERALKGAAIQTERVVLFSSFLVGAAVTRKRDSSAHKRFILLATIVPIDAALNRMPWATGFPAPSTPPLMLALLMPLLIYDLTRFRRLHKVTAIGGGLFASFWIAMIIWLEL